MLRTLSVIGFAFIAAPTLGGLNAHAASRSVIFSGTSNIPYLSSGFSDQARIAYCTLTVVNIGNTDQKISKVSFINTTLSGGSISSSLVEVTDPNEQIRVTPTATSLGTASSCIGSAIPPNGYCTILKRISTAPVGGIRNVHCSGRIYVEDSTSSQPGSVIASGSVVTLQESMVMGGVLSAAHYYGSYTENQFTTRAAKFDGLPSNHPAGVTDLKVPGGYGTNQMNLSCYANCYWQTGGTPAYRQSTCQASCGMSDTTAGVGNGLSCYANCFWQTRGTDADRQTTCQASCGMSGTTAQVGAFGASSDKFSSGLKYSGGIVHEITMGPFLSICSGNSSYHAEGGIEFSHSELTRDAAGTTTGVLNAIDQHGGIPERLYCMHRHSRDDLFSRVGATSSFAINGGNPF